MPMDFPAANQPFPSCGDRQAVAPGAVRSAFPVCPAPVRQGEGVDDRATSRQRLRLHRTPGIFPRRLFTNQRQHVSLVTRRCERDADKDKLTRSTEIADAADFMLRLVEQHAPKGKRLYKLDMRRLVNGLSHDRGN